MRALSAVLITGTIRDGDEEVLKNFFRGVTRWLARGLAVVAGFFLSTYCLPIQGSWVDQAFSESLSHKYNSLVTVRDVKIAPWSDITFGALMVSSKQNKSMITALNGTICLKKLSLRKKEPFETDIGLSNVAFTKEFYKDSPVLSQPFGYLMRKPLRVKYLKVKVTQDERFTKIGILQCTPEDIRLSGEMIFDYARLLKDAIQVSFSPLQMLSALLF